MGLAVEMLAYLWNPSQERFSRGVRTRLRMGLAGWAFLTLGGWSLAQTTILFWHSQVATEDVIEEFAEAFNAQQDDYRVVPRYVGPYQEGAIRLVNAMRGGEVPALFDAELTLFLRLHFEGVLQDLRPLTDELPSPLLDDLQPAMWSVGEIDGARYGLPWHMSVPILAYNANVFSQLGVEPPSTWEEFEQVAQDVTTRNAKGFVDVAVAFLFEAQVLSRGGTLVSETGEPRFVSDEAIAALEMSQRLADAGASIPRSFGSVDQALVDFVRGRVMMAFSSEAFIPSGERFTAAFELGTAPLPRDSEGHVPFTGGQLVIPTTASEAERDGAFAFWQFLMQPDNVETWVRASYFLPVLQSVEARLGSWYAENPNRGAGVAQLDVAVLRPRTPAYALWQTFLEEGIERATIGGMDAEAALQEVQRRALTPQ